MNVLHEILETSKNHFMRFGIRSVTMDDLSRELGMSKKTLYNYFSSKSELVKKVVLHHNEEEEQLLKNIKNQNVDAIKEMLLTTDHVRIMLKNFKPTIIYDLKKYYKSSWKMMESLHNDFLFMAITHNIQKGKEKGLYREDVDSNLVARFYTSMTFNIMEDPNINSLGLHMPEIFQAFMDYHLHGIMTNKGIELYKKYNSDA